METVRRALRALLGSRGVYSYGASLLDFLGVLRHDGFRTWMLLRRLRSRKEGSPPVAVRFRNLLHPISVRPGTLDVLTILNTVVREEWGDFDPTEAPMWMIDAGAYIGDTATYFLSRFPSLQVIALEPNPNSFDLARANLLPYGERAILLKVGLWPTDGRQFLSGDSTTAKIKDTGVETETANVRTLLERYNISELDILKMDIEGAETAIFATEVDSWLPRVKLLIMEIHGPAAMSIVKPALARHGFGMRQFRSVWYCARAKSST